MPHKTTWEDKGINLQFYGDITTDEVEQSTAEAYGDHRFDDIKYFIWDMTDAESLITDEAHVESTAAESWAASTYKTSLKGAIVSNDNDICKFIEHYIATSSKMENPWELKLFSNTKDATKWVLSALV